MPFDPSSALAALNLIGGGARPNILIPAAVREWAPSGQEIREPAGIHGFAKGDTPRVIAGWVAHAKVWATPEDTTVARMTDTAKLAGRYKGMLSTHKYAEGLVAVWEQLMQLYRDGSGLRPVPWAWWRLKNAPNLTIYQVFSAEVLATPWRRAKFWEETGSTFRSRVRLYPKASAKLITLQRVALTTGKIDMEVWDKTAADELAQRMKIGARVQQAWTASNLALWLAEGDELLDALRLKAVAVAQL